MSRTTPWRTRCAAAIAIGLLLGGCGSDASSDVPSTSSSSPDTGGEASGPAVALPATFPVDEIPLVPGTIGSASVIPNSGWNVVLTPETPLEDVAAQAGALVEAAGFTLFTQSNDPDSDNRAYRNESYDVFINLQDSDGTVSYAVLTR